MKKLLFSLSLWALSAAADYGEQPLRGNLTDKPFGQTEGGREDHRFASSPVNQYRIYDYYARQARYYLAHPEDKADLLLPFTELDGGRRGHWGVTNEPATTAYKRQVAPEFDVFVDRGMNEGVRILRSDKALIVCQRNGNLKEVLLDAQISGTPNGLLRHKVDILGLNGVHRQGKAFLLGVPDELLLGKDKPEVDAFYFSGKQIVCRKSLGAAKINDHAEVIEEAGLPVFVRHLELEGGAEDLRVALPQNADKAPLGATESAPRRLLLTAGKLQHLVLLEGEAQLNFDAASQTVRLSGVKKAAQLRLISWIAPSPADKALLEKLETRSRLKLATLLAGGAPRLSGNLTVKCQLNADPAAARGSYEIDDIGVPIDNPWNLPMCLSGLAFDGHGGAYASTLTGEIWRLQGLDSKLLKVTWKRYAMGLNQPMGIQMVDGFPVVCTKTGIIRLRDLNHDDEADVFEFLNRVPMPGSSEYASLNGLERDAKGNFYFGTGAGIFRMTPDGKRIDRIGGGSRNPLGLSVTPEGLASSDTSEGDNENGCCSVHESEYSDNRKTPSKNRRLVYLPRGIDNSAGDRIVLNDERFGPLGKSIYATSFGSCSSYFIIRDANEGAPQGALMPMPGDFASGVLQLCCNPEDGQLYTVGIDGWGDYAVAEGSMHRIRWNGKACLLPSSWQAHRNGIVIAFNEAVKLPSTGAIFVQQWNNVDYRRTYGSPDYSVKNPDKIGHDRLKLEKVHLLPDGKSFFLEIPELLPAMVTQVYTEMESASGHPLRLDLYATINRMRPDHPAGAPGKEKNFVLTVPTKENNSGDSYQIITEFFDRAAGRNIIARPSAPSIPWKKEELNYQWIADNIISKQCIFCHGKGSPHDFSSYAGLKAKLNLAEPRKSHLYGMVSTKSMPPYPMPTVAPEMEKALLEWIAKGAPEK